MSSTKRLLSNSLIVFIGMTIGNIFSYLFNMVMGRMLGPSGYGELTVLLSFFMVASVASGAILTITMRYSGELYFSKSYLALKKFYDFIFKNVIYLSAILVLVILVLIKPIATFFSITSWLTILPILVAVIFILILTVNKGFLQGVQRFSSVSYLGAIEMFMRFAFGLALVYVGWHIYGALVGITVATILAYVISIFSVRKVDLKKEQGVIDDKPFDKKEMLGYGLPVLFSSIMLILSLNMDIFLVKHYFSSNDAGLYAAVSVISKIILYVGSPIISVMFPMISEHRAKGEKHYKVFLFSLVLTLLLSLLVLGVYTIAPGTVIKILYGPKYTALYSLLPEIGLAFLFYSLVNLMSNYYMAIKDFTYVWFYAITIILQIVAVSIWHSDLLVFARIFIFSFALLFAVMMVYYTIIKRSQIKELILGRHEE